MAIELTPAQLHHYKEEGYVVVHSWLMIPRAHPGKTPFKNPAPIIYFGSSWATLGLLRSMPKELTRHSGE